MEDWKEFIHTIQSASDEIEIPEELQPEAVEQLLKTRASKKKKRKIPYRWGGMAAAAMVAIVVMAGVGRFGSDKSAFVEDASMEAAPVMEEGAEEECIEEAAPMEAAPEAEMAAEEGAIPMAGSYEEIYERLADFEAFLYEDYRGMVSGSEDIVEESAAEAPTSQEPMADMPRPEAAEEELVFDSAASDTAQKLADTEKGGAEYSTTNTREESVDEADIVKTDGRYIYTCTPATAEVKIVRAEDLVLCENLRLDDVAYVSEIYVENERLTILGSRSTTGLAEDEEGFYYSEYQTESVVKVYDIQDPEAPKAIGEVSQEGNYYSSRKVGDYLYLFTNCRKEKKSVRNVDSYIPEVNGKLLASDSVYMPSDRVTGRYLLISSIDLRNPAEVKDAKGILCDSTDIYISHQNIYITQNKYDTAIQQTEIFQFWFYHGMIFSRAAGLVEGSLSDSFCIDEHEGNLRLVTTAWTDVGQKCSLYVLDGDLKIIGRLENVAPDEEVKSARLMGDVGYFVTFRQVDPLFCVDLSDPTDPKILGELKVSGFSTYLHPYGDGLMLGMGQEADINTGRFEGYKISMFDVSQPGQMAELDKAVFKDVNMVGLNNYKTVLADPGKNIIGVCLEKWNRGEQTVYYQIYGFDRENGFTKLLNYEMEPFDEMGVYNAGYIRALYIKDTLYVVSPAEITAFDMDKEYEIIGKLRF